MLIRWNSIVPISMAVQLEQCLVTSMVCRTLRVQVSTGADIRERTGRSASLQLLLSGRIIFLSACCVCCFAFSGRLSCIVVSARSNWKCHAVMHSFVCEAFRCVQVCLAVFLCVCLVLLPCVLHARYVWRLHVSSVHRVQLWWVAALRKLLILFAFCRVAVSWLPYII